MKDKQMIVLVDDDFLDKVEYLRKINDFKNKSETVRKTIEKEYRKEHFYATKMPPKVSTAEACRGMERWADAMVEASKRKEKEDGR